MTLRCLALFLVASALLAAAPSADTVHISLDPAAPGKPISTDLIGVFFEDLNYAADGGLYAELIQNRSFEYQPSEQPTWGALSFWDLVRRDGGEGDLWIDVSAPLHANNRQCALLRVRTTGGGVGLANSGFDGVPVRAGEQYDFSVFTRLLHVGTGRDTHPEGRLPLLIRLEASDGAVLAEAVVEASSPATWKQLTATLIPSRTVPDARLVVLARATGLICLDEVSLFPRKTFRGRKNGLRADLAQAIADLHPRFVRFPGGCLVHGDGLTNLYRWKDTIGPVEQRRGQPNLWRYHQTVGLGYFEYFQFCEDIGAAPLPVVAAGVSCQNSTRTRGTGQQALPMGEMPAYVQELLDLIEYANGDANTPWGAKRAAAGHPAPFGLKYLGVGNEDRISPEFRERFAMIQEAIRQRHPGIVIVGTSGPFSEGEDFAQGWSFARERNVPLVDEHYYQSPDWFWANLGRYDGYDRSGPAVYVGEYAAHDRGRGNTLRSALAEAAHLTALERNGDIVRLASYAPLLARRGHTQWAPDLIHFTGTAVYPTINYEVQRLFSVNGGDTALPLLLQPGSRGEAPALSLVRSSHGGDLILKLVNGGESSIAATVNLAGGGRWQLTRTLLAGSDADLVNVDGQAPAVLPISDGRLVGSQFAQEFPARSLTVLRLRRAD